MKEHVKVEIMNIVLSVIMILSCFFAGYLISLITPETETLISLASAGLLAVGIILSQIRAVPTEDMRGQYDWVRFEE